jgi:two-component system, OmpR family, sensor kinase
MPAMLRRRLTFALVALAVAVIVESLVAVRALGLADRHVQRGRVHSDLHLGFVELSADKQRLRTWASQQQLDAGADPQRRDELLGRMRATVQRLQGLADRAVALDDAVAARAEQVQRQDALAVLAGSLDDLDRAVRGARPLAQDADARAAWDALNRLFDLSNGRDLRALLADSMAREATAVTRERAAADRALRWAHGLWLLLAALLALAAVGVALVFTQALRRRLKRLDEGARALQRGELHHRIALAGNDEFAALGRSVDRMAAELAGHREREARARQRLEDVVAARTADLQSALQALQQVDERRRRLFADISHELRTPTTAIRGEAEIALRGRDKPADDYKAALQRIADASRQLGGVIDDLLTMARSDLETLALRRQPLDLADPLADATAQGQALAYERGVQVEAPPVPMGELPMHGDPLRIRQLLLVLLDNAVRYSHAGGRVRVIARRSTDADGGDWAEVEVRDEGIGIGADELPRVFERHFRGDAARRHRADGTGLGLSIAHALASGHGGTLVLHSRPGAGTTAVLRLPLAIADTAAPLERTA